MMNTIPLGFATRICSRRPSAGIWPSNPNAPCDMTTSYWSLLYIRDNRMVFIANKLKV